jgi:NADH dehydrogenase [ubiquinone] 1 alpha subcomplex assembly factor 1
MIMDIIDFSRSESLPWAIVNDGVMGGRSSGGLGLTEEGTALFRGFVSLENNGGFASVRARLGSIDLSEYEGVTLRVRGDGRKYQIRFRTDEAFDGVAYQREFATTAGEWTEHTLSFEDFQPSFRGRVPRGAGPLEPALIRQMGFLIGDKREGPFRLEIAWVRAYGTS